MNERKYIGLKEYLGKGDILDKNTLLAINLRERATILSNHGRGKNYKPKNLIWTPKKTGQKYHMLLKHTTITLMALIINYMILFDLIFGRNE